MPNEPLVQLEIAVAKANVDVNLCEIHSFQELAEALAKIYYVDGSKLSAQVRETIYIGPKQPTGPDEGKIWFKNDGNGAIGIFINGSYKVFNFPAEDVEGQGPRVPVNGLITWPGSLEIPVGYQAMPDGSAVPFELENGYRWIQATSTT